MFLLLSLTMQIIVNGEPKELRDGSTVAELVIELGLDKVAAAVEVNKRLVPKRMHTQTVLNSDDRVEVVILVGGG